MILQNHAKFAEFFGVLSRDSEGFRDEVNNSLARAVPGSEQFEIAQRVVPSVSVDVVDGFAGRKAPAEFLLHNVSVLKQLAGRFTTLPRYVDAPVSILVFAALRLKVGGFRLVGQSPEGRPAFRATQAVMSAKVAAWLPDISEWIAALNANEFRLCSVGGVCLSSKIRAWHGAVNRLTVPFLPHCVGNAVLHGKIGPALFACERLKSDARSGSPVLLFVSALTGAVAKSPLRIARFNAERLATFVARQLDGHVVSPFLNKMENDTFRAVTQGVV